MFAMIRNNDSEELQKHLQDNKDCLNVTQALNDMGFSPLHFAAYKSQVRVCEVLIDFILNIYEPAGNGQELVLLEYGKMTEKVQRAKKLHRRRFLRDWINMHTQGDDSFTALHFASFHGNLKLIRLLIKHGADLYAENKNGVNMLHVSAQGDQPVSLIYFLEKGLQIDSRDIHGRTALHHAATTGNELWIVYAVAFNAEVDARDAEQKTPLLNCCSRFSDHWNTECIKKLLLAGADKYT